MHSTIAVRYFAVLRDASGKSSEQVQVEAGASAGQVYSMLAERYGFPLGLSEVRVAVNDEFARPDQLLKAGDTLAFIPPVSGG